jgi:hypothetical protein
MSKKERILKALYREKSLYVRLQEKSTISFQQEKLLELIALIENEIKRNGG